MSDPRHQLGILHGISLIELFLGLHLTSTPAPLPKVATRLAKSWLCTETIGQGVAKRCRLSWLSNSALVYEPKCGGRGVGELRGLS
jgi:hypothetical protein